MSSALLSSSNSQKPLAAVLLVAMGCLLFGLKMDTTMSALGVTSLRSRSLSVHQEPGKHWEGDSVPIPKTLHLVVIGDPYPAYWEPVIEFQKKKAFEQGFEFHLWDQGRVDLLVLNNYPWFQKQWKRICDSKEGGRIADVARLLILYIWGGVYLDVDMIACGGLEEMTNTPGVISFPFTDPGCQQVSNAAISAPPRHPLLKQTIESINNNVFAPTINLMMCAGPPMVARSVNRYSEIHGLGLPAISNSEEMPNPSHSWLQSGDVRLGKFSFSFKDPAGKMNFWHLAFASWFPHRELTNFPSKCETQIHLISPFLEENCPWQRRQRPPSVLYNLWSGNGNTHSVTCNSLVYFVQEGSNSSASLWLLSARSLCGDSTILALTLAPTMLAGTTFAG